MSLFWTSNQNWKKENSSSKRHNYLFNPPSPTEYDLSSTMVEPIFDYQFRVILIGDSTVGKSSLLRYFTDGTFAEVSDPTVGVDFFARLMPVSDNTVVKLQLWDTAGQERFRSITKSYYRNSVGVVLTYDICNRDSFNHVPIWMQEAKRHIEPYKAVFVLVGCKKDLADSSPDNREVELKQAQEMANFHGIKHFETSAKSGCNVHVAFAALTQTIFDKLMAKEYKLDDRWDGIKGGYFNSSRSNFNYNPANLSAGIALMEGEPASKHWCC